MKMDSKRIKLEEYKQEDVMTKTFTAPRFAPLTYEQFGVPENNPVISSIYWNEYRITNGINLDTRLLVIDNRAAYEE